MYPFIKWATTVLRATRRPTMHPGDESVVPFRVGLNDIDPFMEFNNARFLNYMELGRWDYSQRVGFVRMMRQRKWGIAVGARASATATGCRSCRKSTPVAGSVPRH